MQKQIREYRIAVAEMEAASKNYAAKEKVASLAGKRLHKAVAARDAKHDAMLEAIAGDLK